MAYRPLYHGQPSDTAAAVYTSTNVYTTITAFTVVNTTASAVTLTAWIVPSAGSRTDANLLLNAMSVPADEDGLGIDVPVVHTLDKDAELHLEASAATALTVCISGDVSD